MFLIIVQAQLNVYDGSILKRVKGSQRSPIKSKSLESIKIVTQINFFTFCKTHIFVLGPKSLENK